MSQPLQILSDQFSNYGYNLTSYHFGLNIMFSFIIKSHNNDSPIINVHGIVYQGRVKMIVAK